METENLRIIREKKTIHSMIKIFCYFKHKKKNRLCSECSEILDYALFRLKNCPHHENKPTCAKCPNHCYNPTFRPKIKLIMRYSGPRMLFIHPFLTVHHLVDGFRSKKKKTFK
jgi:hypothetical protein